MHLSSDNLGPGDGENGQGEGGDGRDDKGRVKDGQHRQHLQDHHIYAKADDGDVHLAKWEFVINGPMVKYNHGGNIPHLGKSMS